MGEWLSKMGPSAGGPAVTNYAVVCEFFKAQGLNYQTVVDQQNVKMMMVKLEICVYGVTFVHNDIVVSCIFPKPQVCLLLLFTFAGPTTIPNSCGYLQ
jgi:hypothetical protein